MVDLMRDTGGIIEQLNPAKLSRPVAVDMSTNVRPIPVAPMTSHALLNGKSTKIVRKKK